MNLINNNNDGSEEIWEEEVTEEVVEEAWEEEAIEEVVDEDIYTDSPKIVAKKFLEYLGNQQCHRAYLLQNNSSWGNSVSFCKKFNSIENIEITKVETEAENNYEASVLLSVIIEDSTSKHGRYTVYKQRYFLEKQNSVWKIIKMKVLSSEPY